MLVAPPITAEFLHIADPGLFVATRSVIIGLSDELGWRPDDAMAGRTKRPRQRGVGSRPFYFG